MRQILHLLQSCFKRPMLFPCDYVCSDLIDVFLHPIYHVRPTKSSVWFKHNLLIKPLSFFKKMLYKALKNT